jgi:hypothetical protein
MFDIDWGVAVKGHSLAWFIVKTQCDPKTWKGLDRHAAYGEVDGHGSHSAISL